MIYRKNIIKLIGRIQLLIYLINNHFHHYLVQLIVRINHNIFPHNFNKDFWKNNHLIILNNCLGNILLLFYYYYYILIGFLSIK